jgi:peptide deformylase
MSELIIDTGSGISKQEQLQPLPIYGDEFTMLREVMPEMDVSTLPNEYTSRLAEQLRITMRMYNGFGLSANQCGVKARMFVIGTDAFNMTCINPKIVGKPAEHIKRQEGCLSYPGLFVTIARSSEIDVEFYNEQGELKQVTLSGITAQCFQHELDHLNGITFTSKVGPVALQLAKKKQTKLMNKVKKHYKNGLRI